MMFAASGENSSPANSAKVVSCRCGVATHVPGPMAALKVAGSQLSTNAIFGSLLLTWAFATFVQLAQKTANTARPLAQIANFFMFCLREFFGRDSQVGFRHEKGYTRLRILEP